MSFAHGCKRIKGRKQKNDYSHPHLAAGAKIDIRLGIGCALSSRFSVKEERD